MQVALDEEVSSEQAESFRKQVARLRHPHHPLLHFALAPRAVPALQQAQPKHHTLKYVPTHYRQLEVKQANGAAAAQPKHHTRKYFPCDQCPLTTVSEPSAGEIPYGILPLAEKLPPRHNLPWPVWKSINRQRTQVARS